MIHLSKSERKVLNAIWASPEKSTPYTDLFSIAGSTVQGARTVLNRMVDRRLVSRSDGALSNLTITWAGMNAIGVNVSTLVKNPRDPKVYQIMVSGKPISVATASREQIEEELMRAMDVIQKLEDTMEPLMRLVGGFISGEHSQVDDFLAKD